MFVLNLTDETNTVAISNSPILKVAELNRRASRGNRTRTVSNDYIYLSSYCFNRTAGLVVF